MAPLSLTMLYAIDKAPCSETVFAIGKISWLLMDGIIGANITLTGMPWSDKILTVSKRFLMVAVRGSNTRLVVSDNEVIDIFTLINWSLASSFIISKSRIIKAFLVIIPTGCLYFKNTSRHCRL